MDWVSGLIQVRRGRGFRAAASSGDVLWIPCNTDIAHHRRLPQQRVRPCRRSAGQSSWNG